MPCRRNNFASASSVSLFPRPRIRDITSDRLVLVKTSDIQRLTIISGQRETPFHFFRCVRKHPVIKSRPLRVARIQFLVCQFARVSAPPRLGGEAFEDGRPAAFGVIIVACPNTKRSIVVIRVLSGHLVIINITCRHTKRQEFDAPANSSGRQRKFYLCRLLWKPLTIESLWAFDMNAKPCNTAIHQSLKLWALVMNPRGNLPIRIVCADTSRRTTQLKRVRHHVIRQRREQRVRERAWSCVFHNVEARRATRMGCLSTTCNRIEPSAGIETPVTRLPATASWFPFSSNAAESGQEIGDPSSVTA